MDKTRMGKRVASLLLSLVMMLSLLPTAAYATMADGVETQGAIVSENGTGVSDDSNSSGNTDDLQVGGSKDSGTADDTTGAEGGADPTDSVNGNDSADPQDDGDAVLPVASSVVSTSEELVAAIAAANDGDTITLGEGEFTTYGNTSPKKSLTFVGAGTGTVWTIGNLSKDVKGEGNGDCSFDDCETITFKNMTLKVDNKNYRGFIRINHTVVENCTLEGRTAYWGYETAKFVGSTFTAPEGDYALWDYSTKDMSFDGCKFNISGKGVHVYVEAGNAGEATRTVEVNNCTVESTKESKAFLNIKNSTQSYDVTLSGTNTVNGLTADGTTGSALYQVETTEVTETTGNPVTVKQANTAGELETVYEVKQPSANVAKVGDTEYATLDKAIAALSSSSYTLQLLDKSAWNEATPVYWAAGSESGYAATLADALTAAYKANGDITIVCRPGADVGKLTHGHVADDITIYGNNAYISSGECELEVDTYMFSRDTGKQVTTGGAYLDKDITVTAYELDNLGVWGQRHTDHKVTVNLADCDSTDGITVQRVYISGTTGVNDITLTGCDFGTKATSVYSNADGAVVIDNCSFTGAQVPVNFNHKANGTQTVAVQNSTFTNCGDNGDWKQFAAPVRFVNSGSGTMDTTVNTCTFTDTVGSNGDILLGDGRVDQNSNDVALTVESTKATVQAQQPGYYGKDGTTDASKQGTRNVAAGDKLTTSVTQLMPSDTTTYVAEVGTTKYETLQAAIDAAAKNATVTLLADTRENVTISTYGLTLDLNGHTLNGGTVAGKPALTVKNRVTVKDSSAAQTGTIMREDTAENSGVSSHYVIDIQDGWLFFESGSVTNNSGVVGVKGASLVRVGDDSVAKYPGLTISGGTFTQDNFIVIKVDRGTFYLKEDGTLNSKNSYAVENWKFAEIKGGTVNGAVAAWTYSGGHNSDLTISGGTVNGDVTSVNYGSAEGKVAKVSITGGTVNGALDTRSYDPSTNELTSIDDATKATIAVTGGTFSSDPTKYVVENSGVTPNGDGTFGVAKAYLAKVGDTSYYTMDEAFKAQTASGEAIVLLRDYTTGSTFNSGSIDRTVDLAGHTWTCTGKDANSAAFEINNSDVTLTVKNGKVVSSQLVGLIPSAMGGTIKYDNSSLVFDGVVMTTTARSGIETNGNNTNDTVTLRNSTLNVPNGFGIYFPSSGTLTIDNSVINAKTMGVQVCAGSLNISGAGTAITVSGDGIDKTINDGAIEDGAAISIVNRTGYKGLIAIKVEGGTFKANGTNAAVKAYDWDNTNKTESDFTQAAKVSVSGGTFSSAVDKSLCADGYIPTQNADGTFGVKVGKYVAEIGSQGYESLAEAIDAAQDGQTVTLLADVADCGSLTISKNITLDGGGHTISGNSSISVNMPGNAAADVTIKNVNFKDIANGNKLSAFYFSQVKGKLTITGCTFDSIEYEAIQVTPMEGAEVNVSNNVFKAKADGTQVRHIHIEMAYGSGFDCEGQNIKLTVTDNQLHGTVSGDASMGIWWVGTDSTLKVDGNYMEHPETVSITLSNGGVHYNRGDLIYPARSQADVDVDDLMPAVIVADKASGESKIKAYSTLAEAVAAAQDGQTVRLLADVAESSIKVNANITIDLNKMTVTGSFVTYGEVTIQNGTIDVPDGKTNYAYGKLTLADVDITGKAASSSLLSVNYNGSVTIDKDSTIVADSEQLHYPAVFIKGQDDSGKTYAPELNIYGTVQSAKTPAIQGNGTDRGVSHVNVFEGAVVKSEKLAIYLPQPCEVNITGGLVEGYCGIGIKSGTLNISGGTVRGVAKDNAIGDEYSQTNGISYDGSAIMIDSYIGYAGQVQINVSGNAVVESKYSTAIREIGNDKSQTNLVGLDITGGTVLGAKDTDAVLVRDVTAKDVNISGGEFSSIVKKEYCAPGFTPVTTANSEGRYGVKVGMFTVKVTSRTTGSDSPVANVAGGGSDITYAEGITVTASAISGYNFVGWFVNEYTGTPYSTDLTCEVKPTDDWTMIAVYEPISGGKFWLTVTASEFTVNGGAVQDSYLYEQFAVGASVTVNFTGSENFLYWVNASNKVVSTDKSYTFIMGSETTLKAVYGKARQNQATVVFISHSDQIISSKAYTTSDTIQFPVPPIKMGCTFTGWSMTEAEIRAAMANNSGIIQVRARYTEPSIACKVTVIYPDGIGNEVVNAVVGKAVNVTAKDIEGKTFSYWTDDKGTVLGYTKTLKLAPSGDMTVKAVYGENAEVKPVISMTAIDASAGNGYWVVSFTATRAVPAGYEMVKQGILYSLDSRCAGEAGKDYLKLTADGTVPEGVYEYSGKDQALNGVTRFNGNVGTADTTLYGRGYMILKNSAGEVLYVYADTILSGSYNSLKK